MKPYVKDTVGGILHGMTSGGPSMKVKACRLISKLIMLVDDYPVTNKNFDCRIRLFGVDADCWSGKLAVWIDIQPIEVSMVGDDFYRSLPGEPMSGAEEEKECRHLEKQPGE